MVHVATDWPGHFPNVGATLRALTWAGADVNARMSPHPKDPNCVETPLYWAASSDDVAAIDALLDLGANIEATGGDLHGRTAALECGGVRQLGGGAALRQRGARPTWWQGAALGMLDVVTTRWHDEPMPTRDDVTRAFWHACRGAQQPTLCGLGGSRLTCSPATSSEIELHAELHEARRQDRLRREPRGRRRRGRCGVERPVQRDDRVRR